MCIRVTSITPLSNCNEHYSSCSPFTSYSQICGHFFASNNFALYRVVLINPKNNVRLSLENTYPYWKIKKQNMPAT